METISVIFLGLTIGTIMLLLVINLVIADLIIIGFGSKGFTKINNFLIDTLFILFVPTVLLGLMNIIVKMIL